MGAARSPIIKVSCPECERKFWLAREDVKEGLIIRCPFCQAKLCLTCEEDK